MPDTHRAGPGPQPMDDTFIASAHVRLRDLLSVEARCGSAAAVDRATRLYGSLIRIPAATVPEPLSRDFSAVLGELAEIAGWFLFQTDQQPAAAWFNARALGHLEWAGHRHLELLTLQNMAMQAQHLRRPSSALTFIRQARRRGRLTPRLQALFLARAAQVLAQQRRIGCALRAHHRARSLYLDGVGDLDPPWIGWIDDQQMAVFEAMTHDELGHHERAAAVFAGTLEAGSDRLTSGSFSRSAYLFSSLVRLRDWRAVEEIIGPLHRQAQRSAPDVTTGLLRRSTRRLLQARVRPSLHESARHLSTLLAPHSPSKGCA